MSAREPGAFVALTETWDMPMPVIEQDMLFRRYQVLADLARGTRVLEIGCGTAMGNEVLCEVADFVASFDLELGNVRTGQARVEGSFGVGDAQSLPFASASFDVVAGFEMAYYVPDQEAMIAEAVRVLRPDGALFLAVANPERPAFHRSPHSTTYLTARTSTALFARHGLAAEVSGVFPISDSPMSKVLRLAIRTATALHLVPKTLGGRAFLKRVVQGKLAPYPGHRTVQERASTIPTPVGVPGDRPCAGYSVLYVVGRRA